MDGMPLPVEVWIHTILCFLDFSQTTKHWRVSQTFARLLEASYSGSVGHELKSKIVKHLRADDPRSLSNNNKLVRNFCHPPNANNDRKYNKDVVWQELQSATTLYPRATIAIRSNPWNMVAKGYGHYVPIPPHGGHTSSTLQRLEERNQRHLCQLANLPNTSITWVYPTFPGSVGTIQCRKLDCFDMTDPVCAPHLQELHISRANSLHQLVEAPNLYKLSINSWNADPLTKLLQTSTSLQHLTTLAITNPVVLPPTSPFPHHITSLEVYLNSDTILSPSYSHLQHFKVTEGWFVELIVQVQLKTLSCRHCKTVHVADDLVPTEAIDILACEFYPSNIRKFRTLQGTNPVPALLRMAAEMDGGGGKEPISVHHLKITDQNRTGSGIRDLHKLCCQVRIDHLTLKQKIGCQHLGKFVGVRSLTLACLTSGPTTLSKWQMPPLCSSLQVLRVETVTTPATLQLLLAQPCLAKLRHVHIQQPNAHAPPDFRDPSLLLSCANLPLGSCMPGYRLVVDEHSKSIGTAPQPLIIKLEL